MKIPLFIEIPDPQTGSGLTVQHLETTAELVTAIPISIGSQPANSREVYGINLPDLKVGDILQITSQVELTTPYTYNCMVGRYLKLGAISNVTKWCAENLIPAVHHGVYTTNRQYKITANMVAPRLSLMMYAAAANALANQNLVVEQGYGHLDVVILKS